MSDKPTTYLNKWQVYKLNEQHGYFQHADAQGDVSRAFANDAIDAYLQMCAEASEVTTRTGLTLLELEEHRDELDRENKQLREALEQARAALAAQGDKT
ncbi:hypothetical protein G7048_19140 [Diaphorobacter sp. HDW4B]|uniref:hypothetical protein n=1 Tax=Diaphorobacter sp. HDW4B TaxID=2714925 RepID=UPI00140DCB5C|nr:hypothetical protein [Diaphorobacter sp. HDW4B]QIL72282.1 hypothetical protein G7048_19140 [Diaphorobacter sp. HDW4B]